MLLRSANPRPEYDLPSLPDDITVVSDSVLMVQLREQTEWLNFFASQVVLREIAEADAEVDYDRAKAGAFVTEDKQSVTAAKALRDSDPVVLGAQRRWRDAKNDRKAMQMVMESRERFVSLVSREISRRIGRDGPQRRADWNGGG